MLYEFSMTPDLFDNTIIGSNESLGVILIQLLRGIAENGLLANLHKDRWVRHVSDYRIKNLRPSLRDKVLTYLNILSNRHRLVRHPKKTTGDPQDDMEWLDLAWESHERIPFHGIILSQILFDTCSYTDPALIEFSGVLDSAGWLNRQRTLTLTKCEADYRSALATILRHAKSLSLADPWLNTQESRYMATVRACSEVMGQRGHARLLGRIHIHAEFSKQRPLGKSLDEYLEDWKRKLNPLKKQDGHRFRVFLWESLPGSESLHDRFILTDQCGISVPGGLDCRTHSHPNSTNWNLLDEEARILRLNDYDPQTSPFSLRGQIEVQ